MKKLLSAIAVLLCVTACSFGSNSAENVAKAFVQAGYEGDADKMISFIHIPADQNHAGMSELLTGKIKMAAEVKKKQADEKGGVKDITAKTMDATENQPDDQKRVSINITFGNGSSVSDEVNLIKVDSKWKVKM